MEFGQGDLQSLVRVFGQRGDDLLVASSLPKDDPERVAAEWDAAVYVAGFPLPDLDKIDVGLLTLEKFTETRLSEIEERVMRQLSGPLRRVVRYLRRSGWTVDMKGDGGLLDIEDVEADDHVGS